MCYFFFLFSFPESEGFFLESRLPPVGAKMLVLPSKSFDSFLFCLLDQLAGYRFLRR